VSAASQSFWFEVLPDDAGARLDQFLAGRAEGHSRARLQQLIEQGQVQVDGRAAQKSGLRLKAGQAVTLEVPPPEPTQLVPQAMGLRLLYEDAHLVVIDKPAGVAVHPGAGVRSATLVHGLLHQIEGLAGIGGELRPGIVHRLDKDTSGCLAVAKTEAALRALQAAFKARTVEKEYLALVHGAPAETGTLDTLYARHPIDRKRFSSKVKEGRRAVTRWRVLARAQPSGVPDRSVRGAASPRDEGLATLLRVELLTGRTHQIRAHFADAGHPLLADALYGGTRREARLPEQSPLRLAAEAAGRQWLHARRLAFEHPVPGAQTKRIDCTSPLPPELQRSLALLGIDPSAAV
jgi:23S rRNA pseudouridine1911/1915/1917 synthase